MDLLQNPEFGDKLITLMAALVLVLQIAMVGQRWLVMNIRMFGAQSFLLAAIAGAIAWYNSAPHIYIAAVLTLLVKAILVPDRCWSAWWTASGSARRSSRSSTCRSRS